MIILRTIIILALAIPVFWLSMRFNMHMFQQNGYKNKEQITWLKKNIRKEWVLPFGLILTCLRFIFPNLAMDIILLLYLLLELWVFRAMKRIYSKKKLVFTARVKRLIATEIILAVVILLIGFFTLGLTYTNAFILLIISLQFVTNIVSNIINAPIERGVKQYYINDAKKKLRSVEGIQVIGVTGSYGKTSVKFYLKELLQAKYSVLCTPESYNTPMGVVITLRGQLKPTHEIFICEMGARHVGDIKEICDIVHPDHGIITSVGPQHLETFFNMENIQKTKFELADALPEGGMLFLNGDNEYILDQAKKGGYQNPVYYHAVSQDDFAPKAMEYGIDAGAGYYASDIQVSMHGTSFTVTTPDGETESFQTRLIGEYNVANIVGAIAVSHQLGISLAELKIPVRRLQPVPHRMAIREQGSVTIIDDAYNSNPVGSKAAVETLALFDGTKILITPGMVELGEKEEEYNYKFGTYAAHCCDYIFLVGEKRAIPIREGILSEGFDEKRIQVFSHVEDAIAHAYTMNADSHKYVLLENDLPDNY